MARFQRSSGVLLLCSIVIACSADEEGVVPGSRLSATMDATRLARHVQQLASDEFEGRSPSYVGEEKTVAYLEQQFRALSGLEARPSDAFERPVAAEHARARTSSAKHALCQHRSERTNVIFLYFSF